MDGIVSILEDKYYSLVQQIWKGIQNACALEENDNLTIPHFSWHVAHSYPDEQSLDALLESTCSKINPFTVRTAGLGIFFQPRLVVYMPVVKTPALIRVHQMLWEQVSRISEHPLDYYAPDSWIPHITLVYEDLSISGLTCALKHLAGYSLEWELLVDNLALIGQSVNQPGGICLQHRMRGEL